MRAFLVTLAVFLALSLAVAAIAFVVMIEPGSEGRVAKLETSARLWLFRHGWLEDLTKPEMEKLYRQVCTRKCHGREVIERTPRTAMEWEMIVTRMRTAERAGVRADITLPEARTVTGFLQRNHLSNVPTVLPPHIMKYLKKHLWRIDFGERDIYLDVILLPRKQRWLANYLAMTKDQIAGSDATFLLYVNTHQGVVPPWDMNTMAVLDDGRGNILKPIGWKVIYEDNDKHHRQGILTFPPLTIEDGSKATWEMTLKLPNMRKRVFQWFLPFPPMKEKE